MAMRIALPVWNGRISPVFDTAQSLLVIETENGKEVSREEHDLSACMPAARVRRLAELGVELLICGAISNPLAYLVDAAGIGFMPWVSGDVQDVIGAFERRTLEAPRYRMPGCRGRGRRFRRGGGCAGGRGFMGGGLMSHNDGRKGGRK